MDVVVSRYNENLKWIINTDMPYFNIKIYNKGKDSVKNEYRKIPNQGRDGETILRYIIENYYNLPPYVLFLQGNPFEHSKVTINSIYNYLYMYAGQFKGSIQSFESDIHSEEVNGNLKEYCMHLFGHAPSHVDFSPGIQYIISRELIKNVPLTTFQKLRQMLINADSDDENTYINFVPDKINIHVFERIFPMIFFHPIVV